MHLWLLVKTTYIRFDPPTGTGLNLDALKIIGDVTGLYSSGFVKVDAYTGATASNDGTKIADANVSGTVVTDAAGLTYLAVTSTSAYNSVRVRLRYTSGLLGLSLKCCCDAECIYSI
ncbi:hypothetical protein [Pedobacter sp. NJ-S-72]